MRTATSAAWAIMCCVTVSGALASEPINSGYQIVNLGSINDETAFAWGINDDGTSVGEYEDYDGIWKPCWYGSGWPHNIDGADSGYGRAMDINESGRIVGRHAGHGFITDTTGLIVVPTSSWGGSSSIARGVNNSEDVVGTWQTGTGVGAWLYDASAGVFTELENEDWDMVSLNDISDAGISVGAWATSATTSEILAVAGWPFLLGTLGGDHAEASGIEGNWIIGSSELAPGSTHRHAFRYDMENSTLEDLGTLGGDNSDAFGVNADGVVVGWSEQADGSYHACRWIDGSCQRITDLLPAGHGWALLNQATAINSSGYIVGWGWPEGALHAQAFRLSPRPINDYCWEAMELTDGTLFVTTNGASTDGPTPPNTHCQPLQFHYDVWFRYQALCDGVLELNACDADWDCTIAVYEDDGTCANLNSSIVGCTDAGEGCGGSGSRLSVPVTMGADYLVRLGGGGFYHEYGDVNLVVENHPSNDAYAGRLPIAMGSTDFDTFCATTDGNAHAASCQFDGQTYNDVWYQFDSPGTGTLKVSTCNLADYDTDLVAYTLPSPSWNLPDDDDLVACNDDYPSCVGYTSSMSFEVAAGGSYIIRVGGYSASSAGLGTLELTGDLQSSCPEDLDGSGAVEVGDLLALLEVWGDAGGPADFDGSGTVDIGDLLQLLEAWGSDC